ncbi:hypothetical protein BD780_001806 [Clostridium tetanomorphum]|uniref:Putative amidase domain-containing protein n=1 Tax=Clostridium tetanomorphum TaxID=1553 RepID=A0A923EDU9_CLOTT|nr:amidase domain-containing protein [Clostridium tetanomorphum]KAJ52489.1 hypothetical protein CTM_07366 [Clostridium tetanomorphum DSM 665]MBC2399479.1 hypothetical protein [Clostridium tetanomorphum]MBP1864168.1 hypothetical protein [Clostridium tetanomorphum]NRS84581.1 hypothetical protein [Clostridium tetanomorphum]NRZ97795.1 hypothetical protein [Clostridium tetanomorphum]
MKKLTKLASISLAFLYILTYTLNIKIRTSLTWFPISSFNKEELKDDIERIYNNCSKVFITGDLNSLPQYFDTSQKYGKWALEHEVRRVKYLKHWSYQRRINFTDVTSSVLLYKVHPSNNEKVKLTLKEIYKFNYVYNDDKEPTTNSFGVGIRHSVDLIKKDNNWIIFNDQYTDCFEDALKAYSGEIKNIDFSESDIFNIPNCPKAINYNSVSKYNRLKAADYADKYSGASLEEGTDYTYNKKYKNFNGAGGDCTNFASQVLGDTEAGGLNFDSTWYCTYHKFSPAEGSKAFVNADAFKNYLIYSGKGTVIKKGTFKQLSEPKENYPCSILEKLELGDLICYAKGNNMDHFSIVTAWDSHGYPLINSHTTDRYHVPWDLGWGDKNIFFHIIHIN